MQNTMQQVIPTKGLMAAEIFAAIARKMYLNPFARWDSRVDVFLDGHLSPGTKNQIAELLVDHQATIEFTERPGVTKQTWVVIRRPDPTEQQLKNAVRDVLAHLGRNGEHYTHLLPMSVPVRAEQQFKQELLKHFPGGEVTLIRERFKKHQTNVIIKT